MSIKQINDIARYGWIPDFVARNDHEFTNQNDAIYGMNTRVKSALAYLDRLERIIQVGTGGCILTTQGEMALRLLTAEIIALQQIKKNKDTTYQQTMVWPFGENQ